MVGEIPQENPKSKPTSATFLPIPGEFSMKNEDNDGGKISLMDAVQLEIEMEKEKIREEIIASEIHRRQKLEAEVRMELMMEKQIMGMRRFYRGLYVVDDPYNSSTMLMNSGFLGLGLGYQGASLFHKNLLNVGSSDGDFEENLKVINPAISGVNDDHQQITSDPLKSNLFGDGEKEQQIHGVAIGKQPFQRNPNSVAAHFAGKSVGECGGEEVLGKAMPSSGMKRKAETSEPSDEVITSIAGKILQKKKWYCSLCEVSATSAGGWNLHLHGKKHKAKEALSKSCKTASNISTDSADDSLQPMEQAKAQAPPMEEQKAQAPPMEEHKAQVHPVKDENIQVQPMEEDKSQAQLIEEDKSEVQLVEKEKTLATKKWECSLCQLSVTSEILLRSHLQGKKHKAKETKLEISRGLSEVNEKSEVVHKWFCSLCKVSAASENNLNDHFQGKKHKAKAGVLHLEADSVNSNPIEKISEGMKFVQDESLEGDEGLDDDQAILNALNSVKTGFDENTSNNEGKKQETSYEENVESKESEEIGLGVISELVKVWFCKICNEETNDEAAMTKHRKSSMHLNKLRKNCGNVILVSSIMKEDS